MKLHFSPLTLILCFISLQSLFLHAQVSEGGTPYSFSHAKYLQKNVPTITMPAFDVQNMLEEDEILYNAKGEKYRFGKEFNTDISLENNGSWEILPNGDRLWRCGIYSVGAKSMNFQFSQYYLPQGAKLFIYNADNHTDLIGAFTENNNKPYKSLATGLVKGEHIILEYYEPAAVATQGELVVSMVVHAYKNFFDKNTKDYGSSGSCNNNVNCPEGQAWSLQKTSVALILEGGFRACTGATLNNVRQDCTPYFLTANHCGTSVSNWVFMFNYESPSCANQDGPTNQTVSGAYLRATNSNSDFTLMELAEIIPESYNVYMSGWSAENTPGTAMTCIHHPSGDIKKITFDYGGATNDGNFWTISEWEDGTTEPGSSGSPLFDQNKRVVGQLYGGAAACNIIDYDTFGKLAISWGAGSSASNRLKDWLDPDNTGTLIVDGLNCSTPALALDAALQTISQPTGTYCSGNVTPSFSFRNNGETALTSALISYQLNNNPPQTYTWTGNLSFGMSANIILPEISLPNGTYTFTVTISSINGTTDPNANNNQLTSEFVITSGGEIQVNIETDDYGEETAFGIFDQNGETLYEQVGFSSNAQSSHNYCLAPGCYIFIIYDAYGDGMNNFTSNTNDDGSYEVVFNNEILISGGGLFGNCTGNEMSQGCFQQYDFCIENTTPVAPTAAFSASSTSICVGETVTFTDTSEGSPTSWNWTISGATLNTANNVANPSATYPTPGVYNVTLTVSNAVGNDTYQAQNYITVVAAAQADFSFSDNELSYTFSSNATNYESLSWDFGDGNTLTDEINPTHSFDMPGTYEICLTADSDCGNSTYCETIEVSCTIPSLDFDYTIENYTIALSSNLPAEAGTYTWNFGDSNIGSDLNTTHTFAENGTYNVCLQISSICGEDEYCQSVLINCIAPTIDFSTNVNEQTASFSSNITGENISISWDFGDGVNSTQSNPQHVFGQNGDYNVCATVSNGCGSNQYCETISINVSCPEPVAAFTTNASELQADFAYVGSNDVSSYLWTLDANAVATTATFSHTFAQAGTYELCLEVSNDCGNNTYCEQISVCNAPQSAFTVLGSCGSYDFAIENPTAENTYTWMINGETAATSDSFSQSFAEGSYEVCAESTNMCGETATSCQTLEGLISQIDDFQAQFSYQINNNLTVDFSYTGNASSNVVWDFDNGNMVEANNTTETFAPQTQMYNVCVMASFETLCEGTITNTYCEEVSIVCNAPAPSFSFNADALSITANYNGSDNFDGELMWSVDGNNLQGENVTYQFAQSGTYELCVQASNVCGEDTYCETIAVCEIPETAFSYTINDLTLSFSYEGDANSVNSITYSTGDGNNIQGANVMYTYNDYDIYEVCLTVENDCYTEYSCQSIDLSCTQPETPSFSISQNELSFSFEVTAQEGLSYVWDFGDFSANTTGNTAMHDFAQANTYGVCVTAINECGSSSTACQTINANCNSLAISNIEVSSETVEINAAVVFAQPTEITDVTWNFGDGNIISTATATTVTHTYLEEGIYNLCVAVTNICGEITSSCVDVNIITGLENIANLHLSLFPNPSNDYLQINFGEYISGKISVYDIAGKMLQTFTLENNDSYTLRTESLPEGIYFLRIEQADGYSISEKFVKQDF
ncbi:MAG: PKD domain-containing protein [Chitinophagales bacterium]|nr:PKD domain-containing protein [Bacteroidota bacterium]